MTKNVSTDSMLQGLKRFSVFLMVHGWSAVFLLDKYKCFSCLGSFGVFVARHELN